MKKMVEQLLKNHCRKRKGKAIQAGRCLNGHLTVINGTLICVKSNHVLGLVGLPVVVHNVLWPWLVLTWTEVILLSIYVVLVQSMSGGWYVPHWLSKDQENMIVSIDYFLISYNFLPTSCIYFCRSILSFAFKSTNQPNKQQVVWLVFVYNVWPIKHYKQQDPFVGHFLP